MKRRLLAFAITAMIAAGCTNGMTADEYIAAHEDRVASLEARVGQQASSYEPGSEKFDAVRREVLTVLFEVDGIHRGIYYLDSYGDAFNGSQHVRFALTDDQGLPLPNHRTGSHEFSHGYIVFRSTTDALPAGSTFLCGERSCSEFSSERGLEHLRSLVS